MICRQLSDGPCKTYLLVSPKTSEAGRRDVRVLAGGMLAWKETT